MITSLARYVLQLQLKNGSSHKLIDALWAFLIRVMPITHQYVRMDGEQDSSEWTGSRTRPNGREQPPLWGCHHTGAATLVGLPPRGCHHVLGCRLDGSSHLGHFCYAACRRISDLMMLPAWCGIAVLYFSGWGVKQRGWDVPRPGFQEVRLPPATPW